MRPCKTRFGRRDFIFGALSGSVVLGSCTIKVVRIAYAHWQSMVPLLGLRKQIKPHFQDQRIRSLPWRDAFQGVKAFLHVPEGYSTHWLSVVEASSELDLGWLAD